jgi:signal transduction histidine kinase
MMARTLRVLQIDDSEEDGLLVRRELSRAGFEVSCRRVWTDAGVRSALAEPWDFVISDWSMPDGFTGLAAFEIMREVGQELPFVIVSGTIGEEIAVDALKAGVHDFMTKDKLTRLAPTIERELREMEVRRRQREADDELARQRRQIAASERLFREVLAAVPDGVMVVDQRGRMLLHNAAATELLDVQASDTEFADWVRRIEIFQDEALRPISDERRPVFRALHGEEVDRQTVLIGKAGVGKARWFSASARPLRDDGEIIGAVGVFRDMTAERAAQEQLLISDRMASIGMLAAGVAHEINNPLAAVLANLELATEIFGQANGIGANDIPGVIEMLNDAREAADRVRQIVKDLKIFSRHEDDRVGSVDLPRMLESTLRMAWNEIRHRATLVRRFGDTPKVKGTESRLGQVFLNLVVNAAQAIPEGNARSHTITITTGMDGSDHVFVEINDSGGGMSPETLRQIFTPFFTTKRQGEGTGLGLTISHRIISGLGGTIRVESNLGQGTTFRVSLPVADRDVAARVRKPSHAPTANRVRVLAIDDEPMITTAIRRILGADHDVDVATDGHHALELLRGDLGYDLILCDLMMPQMTGMDFYDQVQALRADHMERIVFMTGDAFTAAARTFLDQVPNQCIEKPFDAHHLRSLVGARVR